ncbi:MAG: hypothetical protein JSS09_06085 [Verrucomicrobia bacterium]|nr:hypothetical protein [Verrucomicrobiota bacterium]
MIILRLLSSFILVFCCLFFKAEGGQILYPNFDESMLRQKAVEGNYIKQKQLYENMNKELVGLFKSNYEKNIASQLNDHLDRIPRIIHQIWLGGEVPEKYHEWMNAWASLKGWEYKLWKDEDVASLRLHNRDLYEMATNKGEKSDILRLELLDQYGGIYVDVDYECINIDIFEELHEQYDFYIGFEPLEHGVIAAKNMFKMCNALIGARPHHPLIKHLITNLKANYLAYRSFAGAVERSGPSYLSRIICEYVLTQADQYKNMYLPCTFFYPYTEKDLARGEILECLPETAGIHYWSGSWRKKEPGVKLNQTGNYDLSGLFNFKYMQE